MLGDHTDVQQSIHIKSSKKSLGDQSQVQIKYINERKQCNCVADVGEIKTIIFVYQEPLGKLDFLFVIRCVGETGRT